MVVLTITYDVLMFGTSTELVPDNDTSINH
jgi:hypothetical protein